MSNPDRTAMPCMIVCADGLPHADLDGAPGVGEDVCLWDRDEAERRVHEFDDPDDGGHMQPPLACGPHRVEVYAPATSMTIAEYCRRLDATGFCGLRLDGGAATTWDGFAARAENARATEGTAADNRITFRGATPEAALIELLARCEVQAAWRRPNT